MTVERLQRAIERALTKSKLTTIDLQTLKAMVDDGAGIDAAEAAMLREFGEKHRDKFEPAALPMLDLLVPPARPVTPPSQLAEKKAAVVRDGNEAPSWSVFEIAATRSALTGNHASEAQALFDQLATAAPIGVFPEGDRFLLSSAVNRTGVIGQAQALRAVQLLLALGPNERTRFHALLDKTASPLERAFLYKALGAGYPVAEVADFAARIRGWSNTRLVRDLSLQDMVFDDGRKTGVRQQYQSSCVITVAQVLRAASDPIYALKVRSENDDIHVPFDGTAQPPKNTVLLAEQRQRLEAAGGKATPTFIKGAGVNTDLIDGIYNQLADRTGFTFQQQQLSTAAQREAALDVVAVQVRKGIPAPMLVGESADKPLSHSVIALDVEGSGPTQRFLIHDPAKGETLWSTREGLVNNAARIEGFDFLGAIHVATPARPSVRS